MSETSKQELPKADEVEGVQILSLDVEEKPSESLSADENNENFPSADIKITASSSSEASKRGKEKDFISDEFMTFCMAELSEMNKSATSEQEFQKADQVKDDKNKPLDVEEKLSESLKADESNDNFPSAGTKSTGSSSTETSGSVKEEYYDPHDLTFSMAELSEMSESVKLRILYRNKRLNKDNDSLVWGYRNPKYDIASNASDDERIESVFSENLAIGCKSSDSDDIQPISLANINIASARMDSEQAVRLKEIPSNLNELIESMTSKIDTVMKLTETSATHSENLPNVGESCNLNIVPAASSDTIITKSSINVGNMMNLLGSDSDCFNTQLEKEIRRQISEPILEPQESYKNDPEILSDIKNFSIKRRSHLQNLVEECASVREVMLDLNKLRHENSTYCTHEFFNCKRAPNRWIDFLDTWDFALKSIDTLIEATKKYISLCYKKAELPVQVYDDFVNLLIAVFEDLCDLGRICKDSLDKFRSVCFHFDDLEFLKSVNCFNYHFSPFFERVKKEFVIFTQFDEEFRLKIEKKKLTKNTTEVCDKESDKLA